jgi:hypothetical protein
MVMLAVSSGFCVLGGRSVARITGLSVVWAGIAIAALVIARRVLPERRVFQWLWRLLLGNLCPVLALALEGFLSSEHTACTVTTVTWVGVSLVSIAVPVVVRLWQSAQSAGAAWVWILGFGVVPATVTTMGVTTSHMCSPWLLVLASVHLVWSVTVWLLMACGCDEFDDFIPSNSE